jgi:tRNA pseudouridine55 synthase
MLNTMDFITGEVILIDKPKGWTSFDVVKKVRYLIKTKKVGHAGTLDPLATGLLILCSGKMTKTIDSIQAQEKEYIVDFRLGATTPSYDAEFAPENICDSSHITRERIEAAMPAYVGAISQLPPQFSAVKVDGKRAYAAARAGQVVEIKPRTITVYDFELLDFRPDNGTDGAWASARVRCSKGTYIRTLVHDLGQALGVGAYILELRRTRIGQYTVDQAYTPEAFAALLQQDPPAQAGSIIRDSD